MYKRNTLLSDLEFPLPSFRKELFAKKPDRLWMFKFNISNSLYLYVLLLVAWRSQLAVQQMQREQLAAGSELLAATDGPFI
jgi:hypothetical protein